MEEEVEYLHVEEEDEPINSNSSTSAKIGNIEYSSRSLQKLMAVSEIKFGGDCTKSSCHISRIIPTQGAVT